MPSWEILGKLGLNTSQFESGINRAKKEAKEFGKEVKERVDQAKESIADIAKDTGGGKLASLLGFAGGGAAVTAFGAAVVEAVKEGSNAFSKFETSALQIGTLLKDIPLGDEVEKWIHEISGAGGKVEDLEQAFKSLVESGLTVDQAKEKLLELQKVAVGSGADIKEMAEGFRHMSVGEGGEAGEKESGMARYLKANGPVEQMVKEDMAERIQNESLQATLYGGQHRKEADRIRGMSALDYAKEFLGPQGLDVMLQKATGQGGQYANAIENAKNTQAGKEAEAAKAYEEDLIALGKEFSEGFKPALDKIIETLPKLEPVFSSLGKVAGVVVEMLADFIPPLAQAIESFLGMMQSAGLVEMAENYGLTGDTKHMSEVLEEIHKTNKEQNELLRQVYSGG